MFGGVAGLCWNGNVYNMFVIIGSGNDGQCLEVLVFFFCYKYWIIFCKEIYGIDFVFFDGFLYQVNGSIMVVFQYFIQILWKIIYRQGKLVI